MAAVEVFHTTVEVIRLSFGIPLFVLEKEDRLDRTFDRLRKMAGYVDIDFELFPGFSDKFLLEGPDEQAVRDFFTPEIIRFLEGQRIYHIESNGEALLIFRRLRNAQAREISEMLAFGRQFVSHIRSGMEEVITS